MTVTASEFRIFVMNKYYEYRDELDSFKQYDRIEELQRYFSKNKWFLKNLYRSEKCRSTQLCGY